VGPEPGQCVVVAGEDGEPGAPALGERAQHPCEAVAEAGPDDDGGTGGRTLKEILDTTVRRVDRRAILAALERSAGSPAKAAKLLGISRASIYNKIKEYQIEL
jgi:DNA-binding NtrC family response regulator